MTVELAAQCLRHVWLHFEALLLSFHLFSSLKFCQMAQPCTRPLLNNLAKNLWSRYRGKRAGRSTKTKEANRTYKITQVNPRPKDHSKAKINSCGHDPSNCISITTKPQFTSVPESQARNFVPSLFLSNVICRSLQKLIKVAP